MRTTALLALPLVLGQVSAVAISLIDTILAGHHGPLTLAAVAVGGAVWTLVLLVLIGVLMAVPPSVAQCNGGGRRERIGPIFRQALWLALVLGVGLLMLAQAGSGWLLTAMNVGPEVRPEAEGFVHAIAWGAPAFALYVACRSLSEGLAWTLPTMAFGVLGVALLAPLGYGLMFGAFGLPALGAVGLGLASALVMWAQLLGIVVYLARAPRFADLRLFSHLEPPRWAPIRELLRIGLPMGFSVFMEGSLFVATLLLIGSMGATPVAAHQIAINVASLCFMVPLGVAMATTVRVGHAAGAHDPRALRWAAAGGAAIVLITQTVSALLMGFGRHAIARIYTDDPAIAALAATLLLYAAAFQYPDGIQTLAAGALRGLKDTRAPMWITACAYWALGMPLGWWLGVHLHEGAPGMWYGLILGLLAAAALMAARFAHIARHDHRLMAAVARSATIH
ncbi:MAG: MATE family efflux transporter [Proteobacteria bacterium]|nr:MATE family efflux transporter [Pseudomonadota bacterium]